MTTNSSLKVGCLLPTIERNIDQDRINSYAEASGDFNPIHIDTQYAKETDFRGTIAHGMMIAATISEIMWPQFGKNWLSAGRLRLKFKSPVYPGDTVTTFGEVKSITETDGVDEIVCSVGVRRQTGQIAIIGETACYWDAKSKHF